MIEIGKYESKIREIYCNPPIGSLSEYANNIWGDPVELSGVAWILGYKVTAYLSIGNIFHPLSGRDYLYIYESCFAKTIRGVFND